MSSSTIGVGAETDAHRFTSGWASISISTIL
jgi:hypothetical protein